MIEFRIMGEPPDRCALPAREFKSSVSRARAIGLAPCQDCGGRSAIEVVEAETDVSVHIRECCEPQRRRLRNDIVSGDLEVRWQTAAALNDPAERNRESLPGFERADRMRCAECLPGRGIAPTIVLIEGFVAVSTCCQSFGRAVLQMALGDSEHAPIRSKRARLERLV